MNMERWRWLPDDLGSRYLMVNIPAFRLDVVEGARASSP
jgi:murein L,D-transpeptidase YcbB/YkuD